MNFPKTENRKNTIVSITALAISINSTFLNMCIIQDASDNSATQNTVNL